MIGCGDAAACTVMLVGAEKVKVQSGMYVESVEGRMDCGLVADFGNKSGIDTPIYTL